MVAGAVTRRGAAALRKLERIKADFGPDSASQKAEALVVLESARLETPEAVARLHEALCFLRAYPDDSALLRTVERMLAGFAQRRDLRRHRAWLAGSGIDGTDIYFRFYWFTAEWLAKRWPERLSVDWSEVEGTKLDELLPLMLAPHEALAVEEGTAPMRDLVHDLKREGETDAVFLVRRWAQLRGSPELREQLYDAVDLPLVLRAGADGPSRTMASVSWLGRTFQTAPLERARPKVRRDVGREPLDVRRLSARRGRQLIELGRAAMITRGRDLYAFMHADPGDVSLVDLGEGLQLVCMGVEPEYRHLLYGMHVFLALRNGVPIGYVQACTLFESAEINFNVFDTFRGFEASRLLVASLAAVRALFGVDAFSINTQQLGVDNSEAIATGAWWFYYKHGFRPAGTGLRDIVRKELAARRRDPTHRSTAATLRRLSRENLYLFLGSRRRDVLSMLDLGELGRRFSRHVGESVPAACVARAAALLEVDDESAWSAGERLAWRRWAPVVVALPGVSGWPRSARRELLQVVLAKGGPHEADFIERFHAHARLRAAVLEFTAG